MTINIVKHLENIIKHQTDQSSEDILLSAIDEIVRLHSELADERVDQLLLDELWDRRTEMTDMNEQIKRLREERDAAILERDEARREICEAEKYCREEANKRGWQDCFKEEADANNKAFREDTLQ